MKNKFLKYFLKIVENIFAARFFSILKICKKKILKKSEKNKIEKMQKFAAFFFENFEFRENEKKLILRFSLDGKIFFSEQIFFDFNFAENFSRAAAARAFRGIFLMCGISYFKTFLPEKIFFRDEKFCEIEKNFFEKTWKNGLAEFFFKNKIERKINFENYEKAQKNAVEILNLKNSVVPVGGGKDSILTAEILKNSGENFAIFLLQNSEKISPILQNCAEKIGAKILKIRRILSPNLFDLNRRGAKNGHVPITAILHFLATATAILTNRKNVVFSNENSANEPTILNTKINHQFSKSLEFERDFRDFCAQKISPNLQIFSFLRPLSELKIAEIFCQNFFEKYAENFSSCNQNFKILKKNDFKKKSNFCGNCPKCAFVFLIFAPFLPREKLEKLFGNQNLFLKKSCEKFFFEILSGEKKPFECVGNAAESRDAAFLAQKNWPEISTFLKKIPRPNFAKNEFYENFLPQKFVKFLKNFL